MQRYLVRLLLITPAIFLTCVQSFGQKGNLEIQKGLSDPVKFILPVQKNQMLLGTKSGQFIFWDPSTDQLSSQLSISQGEVNDVLYISSEKLLAIAGSEGVSLYKVNGNITEPLQDIELPNATALLFAEQELIAASVDGLILTGEIIGDNWNVDKRSETGINGVFNVQLKDQKLIVAGIHDQKVYDAKDMETLDEAAHYNTGMYTSHWDEENAVLYLPQEGDLLRLDLSGKKIKADLLRLNSEEGELVTALTADQDGKLIYAATNAGRILQINTNDQPQIIIEEKDNSFTGLLFQDGMLYKGDYFGQTEILETRNWQLINRVTENSTPDLNGVYATEGNNYFISTHFGSRGSAIKIWNMKKASLDFSIPIAQQKIFRILASPNADSIYSLHTDGANWLHVRSDGGYQSILVEDPEVEFFEGFNITLVDEEPMLFIIQEVQELLQLQETPGRYKVELAGEQEEELYLQINNSGPSKKTGLPDYQEVQENYIRSEVLQYIREMDILDRDLLYMKLRGKPEKEFVEIAGSYGIPEKEALALNRLMNTLNEPSFILLMDKEGEELQKISLDKPLKLITQYKDGYQFFFKDELVFWNRRKNEVYQRPIDFSKEAYVYAYMNNALILADENIIKAYPLKNADSTYTGWIGFENEDFLIYDKHLHYKTRGRSKRVLVNQDNKLFPFDAMDVSLNRPDLILDQIPSADSALAKLYRVAIEKRKKRETTRAAVYIHQDFNSLLRLEDLSAMPLLCEKDKITPVFDLVIPEGQPVLEYWVNGVKAGTSRVRGNSFRPAIQLSPGLNKIDWQISTSLQDTILSRTTNYVFHPVLSEANEKLWYFGAGVNNYADSSMNLNYSAKDITDIASAIKGKYPDASIKTLFDKEVTRQNVLKWQSLLQKAGLNDIVLISFSGHGLLTEDSEFYFCTHNTNFDDPAKEGLSVGDMIAMLDSSPARKKVLLIDACQSGLFDEAETPGVVVNKSDNARGAKAIARDGNSGNDNAYRLLQEEFASLQRHNGTIVIAASGGREYAYESDIYRNGVFTYALLNGLQDKAADSDLDNKISIEELKIFLSQKVQEITNGKQRPTSRQENLGFDWKIW